MNRRLGLPVFIDEDRLKNQGFIGGFVLGREGEVADLVAISSTASHAFQAAFGEVIEACSFELEGDLSGIGSR